MNEFKLHPWMLIYFQILAEKTKEGGIASRAAERVLCT